MNLAAATATAEHGSIWPAALAVVVLLLIYAGLCWARPFARCSLCKGVGCWWCGRRGRRLRVGRWLWNRATELHRQAAAAEREADR